MFNVKRLGFFLSVVVAATLLSGKTFAQSSEDNSSSAAAPGTGQTAVKVEEAKKGPDRKVFGEIYNRYDISMTDINRRQGVPAMPNYLGVRYQIDKDQQVSVRQTFNLDGSKEKVSAIMEDTYIHYGNNNLVKWGNTGHLDLVTARAYLPTGETSRNVSGRAGRALVWLAASGTASIFDVTYHHIQDLHIQPNFTAKNDPKKPNLEYYLYNSVEVGKELFKGFNLSIENAMEQNLFKTGKLEQNYQLITQASYSLKPFLLYVAVIDQIETQNPTKPFQLFRENEMSYKFLISAVL